MSSIQSQLNFPAVGKLGRFSAFMCFVVAIGGALAEGAMLWVWLSPSLVQSLIIPHLGLANANVALDGWTRTVCFLISMLPMLAIIAILHQAFKLFDSYRTGDLFNDAAPIRLRRIGIGAILFAFLGPTAGMLLGLALTFGNPSGERIMSLGFSGEQFLIAALGGLILAIGHVMVEAKRLADENKQII